MPESNHHIRSLKKLTDQYPLLAGLADRDQFGPVYVVGGVIRDSLLYADAGRAGLKREIDLAVPEGAVELVKSLAQKHGGTPVMLSERNGAARLVLPGQDNRFHLDITDFRRSDIRADLLARDFTVNALAVELWELDGGSAQLIDPAGGLADLKSKILRPAGASSLVEDPARIMRGYRLAAEHGFFLPPACRRAMAAASPALGRVAAERLNAELTALLQCPTASPLLAMMIDDGVMSILAPEVTALAGVYQNRFHHLDALGHTLETVAALEELLVHQPDWLTGHRPDGLISPVRLKLAALFHDVGKKKAYRVRPDGGLAFYKHAGISVDLWRQAGLRLKFSTRMIDSVAALIGAHMRPLSIMMSKGPTDKAVRRMIRSAKGLTEELGFLLLADSLATRGPGRDPAWEEKLSLLWQRVVRAEEKMYRQKVDPLVTGREIMTALNIPQGPLVGELLKAVTEAQLDGRITDTAGAIRLAGEMVGEKNRN